MLSRPPQPLFAVSGEAYDRFMGRFSGPLAPVFADFAGIEPGMQVLDVGCGPGALTAELARRVGAGRVAAVDPSEQFAVACRERVPDADVRVARAEEVPFADDEFDAALAQLVIGFVDDGDRALAEMRRVVRPGGTVAVCQWAEGRMELLGTFWAAARAAGASESDDGDRQVRYRERGELEELARRGRLAGVRIELLSSEARYEGFDDFWSSIEVAAGPIGAFQATVDDAQREAIREECRRQLGDPGGPFSLSGAAWALRGTVE